MHPGAFFQLHLFLHHEILKLNRSIVILDDFQYNTWTCMSIVLFQCSKHFSHSPIHSYTDGRGCHARCQLLFRSKLVFSILLKDTSTFLLRAFIFFKAALKSPVVHVHLCVYRKLMIFSLFNDHSVKRVLMTCILLLEKSLNLSPTFSEAFLLLSCHFMAIPHLVAF